MKKFILITLLTGLAITLSGCFETTSRSMGATLMPSPIMHRLTPDTTSYSISVGVTGFGGYTGNEYSVRKLGAFGGTLDFSYHMNGSNPFFVNVAVGGMGGSLQFSCDRERNYNCNSTFENSYSQWLITDEGRKRYSFWNMQERILAGFDVTAKLFMIGFAGGYQFFQGASKYDDIREKLDDARIAHDIDGKNDYGVVMAYWIGFYMGDHGKYGNLVAEMDVLHKDGLDNWTASHKLTYTHTTGFFAGIGSNSLIALTLYAGKQFVF